ncbi:ribosomal protein L1 [Lentithecium fluviatile CBS 122367]|uniref:Ribosomal protein L1 n=1 Tax=Lentithecium fluviatile CBS 122367 TaxID=1168545 RepID=A0A6G1J1E6_9PLEO|nr:ribosomal protein L1 [Lentithecium fluviatile CBS 122367]
MAKSKALVKSGSKEEKAANAPLATRASNGTPYQLDPAQVEKAATALVSHMKQHAQAKIEKKDKQSLAADEDEADGGEDPIFLSVSTKQHVHDTSRLKPTKLPLPHPFYPNDVRICLFTKDPQRTYKNLVASDNFPNDLRTKVGRVIGLEKLKKKWKSFESKRQLLAEYDVFMVDDRILKSVTSFLGKIFYGTKAKRPIPIRLTAGARIDKKRQDDKKEEENVVGTAQGIAKEIETALHATYVSMSASANTSIKVGKLSMTPQQLKENVEAVVTKLVDQHIEHKWRNVRALYIKGPTTKALPIWLSEELWVNEEQVLDQAPKPMIKDRAEKGEKKRKWDEWEEELLDPEEIAERRASRKPKKSKTKEPKDVGSISKEKRNKLKRDALQSVQTPLIAG